VPSEAEWTGLVNYLVDLGYPNNNVVNGAGNALKSCRQINSPLGGSCNTSEHPRWESHSLHYGTDEFGFSGIPGGYRSTNGISSGIGNYGYWWSSTEESSSFAWNSNLSYGVGNVFPDKDEKNVGESIRCVKDFDPNMPATHSLYLDASPAGSGQVGGMGSFYEGAEITISAYPNEGYQFVNWTGDINLLNNPNSATATLTMPGYDVSLTANFISSGGTQVVEVLNPSTGKIWMDRNLGASRAATSSTDAEAYGHLYQWGRAADGHQLRTSPTTSTLSTSDNPGHGNFITVGSSPYDWRSPQNDNLWQGVNGINHPCPAGYRLPTIAELEAERLSWTTNNAAGAYNSPLKLPVGGYRSYFGSLYGVGSHGHYWSSAVDGVYARYLFFSSSTADTYYSSRADGGSVRCLKD
jgi:uncharacterized protein (TIGR02145 family)